MSTKAAHIAIKPQKTHAQTKDKVDAAKGTQSEAQVKEPKK
jgi:hypothetical protein